MSHGHKHRPEAGRPAETPPAPQNQEPAGAPAGGEDVPLAKLEQEKGELVARLQRTMADFQNFQKRAARERQEAGQYAVGDFVKQLLPVIDNLERALEVPCNHPDARTIKDGVKIVYDQMAALLASRKIQPIDSTGVMFDPAIHNALMQQPADFPPMTVLQVVQKGYAMDGQTLRAARVIVSSGPAQAEAEHEPPAENGARMEAEEGPPLHPQGPPNNHQPGE